MSRRWGLFFFILCGRGDLHTTIWDRVILGLFLIMLFLRLFLMRWLRFFVVVFCDIYWFVWNNRCYLSKKYELLINLNLYVNWCELVWNCMRIGINYMLISIKLYVNYM